MNWSNERFLLDKQQGRSYVSSMLYDITEKTGKYNQ